MILLDPDLEPDPTPKRIPAKRAGAPGKAVTSSQLGRTKAVRAKSITIPRDIRLPSAQILSRFLAASQAAVRLKGQVTVLLTTDAAIAKLNKQFRGKNKATDVLSFPPAGLGSEGMAGDLAISVTTAMGQAVEQGHSLSTEVKVLVLHGLLHLAGYDHEADEGQMARRESKLRAKLKLPQGLIERVAAGAEKIPSGAKARGSSAGSNVRAKARTLQSSGSVFALQSAQGLKPKSSSGSQAARLKPRPFKTAANSEAVARARSATKAKRL
jgi:probable rRNA maturation factor